MFECSDDWVFECLNVRMIGCLDVWMFGCLVPFAIKINNQNGQRFLGINKHKTLNIKHET